ncbi:MAG: hypothetical protein VB067_08795 [Christensenellaceae bacterium]|nr:hypothetical protein [Christensenellaceae bacterium]MEA5066058.1 hypothetical protein [Eubacteriales bacterium]MEA5069070.1 hypothetical protein [Christensenellaceae bacterium]
MKKGSFNNGMKRLVVMCALALAVALPIAALAEAANQTTDPSDAAMLAAADDTGAVAYGRKYGRGVADGYGMGYCGCGYGLDTGSLTDEQKAAYDSALSLYEQVEDAVLADLITAGIVNQADVDAYMAQRASCKSLAELDQSAWTAEQYKAFYEANAKSGDDRRAAMQDLADAGQLTQAQADALSAQGQSDLWIKIAQNANTNSTIQNAIATLRQARRTLNGSLRDAGMTNMGRGGMGRGGMGIRGGMCMAGMNEGATGARFGSGTRGGGRGRSNARNTDSNHMMGRKGGRN